MKQKYPVVQFLGSVSCFFLLNKLILLMIFTKKRFSLFYYSNDAAKKKLKIFIAFLDNSCQGDSKSAFLFFFKLVP